MANKKLARKVKGEILLPLEIMQQLVDIHDEYYSGNCGDPCFCSDVKLFLGLAKALYPDVLVEPKNGTDDVENL